MATISWLESLYTQIDFTSTEHSQIKAFQTELDAYLAHSLGGHNVREKGQWLAEARARSEVIRRWLGQQTACSIEGENFLHWSMFWSVIDLSSGEIDKREDAPVRMKAKRMQTHAAKAKRAQQALFPTKKDLKPEVESPDKPALVSASKPAFKSLVSSSSASAVPFALPNDLPTDAESLTAKQCDALQDVYQIMQGICEDRYAPLSDEDIRWIIDEQIRAVLPSDVQEGIRQFGIEAAYQHVQQWLIEDLDRLIVFLHRRRNFALEDIKAGLDYYMTRFGSSERPDDVGGIISSPGQTCYLRAAIQQLRRFMPDISDRLAIVSLKTDLADSKRQLVNGLRYIFEKLEAKTPVTDQEMRALFKLMTSEATMGSERWPATIAQQKDANECLTWLMQRSGVEDPPLRYIQRTRTTAAGKLISDNYSWRKPAHFGLHYLQDAGDPKKAVKVQTLFDAYFGQSRSTNTDFTPVRRVDIHRVPLAAPEPFMALSLSRERWDPKLGRAVKVRRPIDMRTELLIEGRRYHPVSAMVHNGQAEGGGHWYQLSYHGGADGEWYVYDDGSILPLKDLQKSRTGYSWDDIAKNIAHITWKKV